MNGKTWRAKFHYDGQLAMKVIRGLVGQNVTITHELLVNCRQARAAYFDALKKDQNEKKKKVTEVKEQEKKRSKLFEKENAAWLKVKENLEASIRSKQVIIKKP